MPKFVHKVVPILLRRRGGLEILVFHHPQTGIQFVKGTLEADEKPSEGALRELAEESGIEDAAIVTFLGQLTVREMEQHWHIFLCRVAGQLPDAWSFFTQDDGGQTFAFFWHDLQAPPDSNWHVSYRRALTFVRRQVAERAEILRYLFRKENEQ